MSSLRLKEICDLVDYNSIVADIGTDHGIIPIELSKKSISKKIIATDISKNSLEKLEQKDLVSILTEPKNALVKQYQKLFLMDEVELEFDQKALDAIASKAIERKTGARGLRSIIESVMMDLMFEIPSREEVSKVVVTKAVVDNEGQPELYNKKGKLLKA